MSEIMSIADAETALSDYIPKRPPEHYTLDKMRGLLAALGDPQERVKSIHVAGTSGKTSTSYFVRGLIEQSGRRTGLTVSPHVSSITERIQLDGRLITTESFCAYLRKVLRVVKDEMMHPSYFEILMALAYTVFAGEKVDYAIIETGLGGLLDGSNTIRRSDKLCVITDIGLDHTEILGETTAEIAAQKAGIVQPGTAVVVQPQEPETVAIIREVAYARGASSVNEASQVASPSAALLPEFQRRNLRLALYAAQFVADRDGWALGEPTGEEFLSMQPPGRMEVHQISDKTIILDGAHNPQKLEALGRSLAERGWTNPTLLATALAAPEEKLKAVYDILRQISDSVIVTQFEVIQDTGKVSPTVEENMAYAERSGFDQVLSTSSSAEALELALSLDRPVIVVTGSLYLVAQIRALLDSEKSGG